MKVGSKVEHVFTKDWLYVIAVERHEDKNDRILCRTKDLREIWFYDFELRQIG
jgi:hypothetical protein